MQYLDSTRRLSAGFGAFCALTLILFGGHAAGQSTRAPPTDFRPLIPPDDTPFSEVLDAAPLDISVVADTTSVFVPPAGGAPEWTPQGPAPIRGVQVENVETFLEGAIEDNAVGPVNVLLTHPDDENTLIAGTANGGIWTRDLLNVVPPFWVPLTDDQFSLSIGAIDFDPLDPLDNTIVAGFGRTSSFGGVGGLRAGLIRSTDGGATWAVVGPDGGDPRYTGDLAGANIRGVAARGNTIVVAVDDHDDFLTSNVGIFRSTDGGATFSRVAALGDGAAVGFLADPRAGFSTRQYTAIAPFPSAGAPGDGVFRSDDSGATWTEISDAAIRDAIVARDATSGTVDVGIAVGGDGSLYVGIVNTTVSGAFGTTQLSGAGDVPGIFRSTDDGATWEFVSFPGTVEPDPDGVAGSATYFLNPLNTTDAPLGQAAMPFALFADPISSGIVYMGGDRQPVFDEPVLSPFAPGDVTNSLDATDFSGRLFRANFLTTPEPGPFEHLTHRPVTVQTMSGPVVVGGTANASAPHADARDFAFGYTNDLFVADDGGVYMRTSPTSRFGRWISVNDDLQVAELHRAEWARSSRTIIGSAADHGTGQQLSRNSLGWESLLSGTGGGLAVDNVSSAQHSFRYYCTQNFGSFRFSMYSAASQLVFQSDPLTPADIDDVAGLTTGFNPQFITPIAVNAVNARLVSFADQTRIFVANERAVRINDNLSVDQIPVEGDTPIEAQAIAYGGLGLDVDSNPAEFEDIMYVAAGTDLYFSADAVGGGTTVFDLAVVSPAIPGTLRSREIQDIRPDPSDYTTVYVVTARSVLRGVGVNASPVWTDITNNLSFVGNIHAVEYLECLSDDVLIVGADFGVYIAFESEGFGTWSELGNVLPNAPVMDLDVDIFEDPLITDPATDPPQPLQDVIVAGTLGRGAFTFESLCDAICSPSEPDPDANCGPSPPLIVVEPEAPGTSDAGVASGLGDDETGSSTAPFLSLQAAVTRQQPGGHILIRGGVLDETLTIDKPLRITASGTVRIGAPQ